MNDTIIVVIKETETVIVCAPGPQGIPGPGIPMGGTTGQGLIKNSSTNFDTGWGIPGLNIASEWTKQQHYPVSELSINGDNSIDWDWDTQPEAFVNLPNSDSYSLNLPSNRQPGVRTLRVYQDSTGAGILSFDRDYILDAALSSFSFGANTFADLYFKDDGNYVTVFGSEFTL
jgi:hypothetical protein